MDLDEKLKLHQYSQMVWHLYEFSSGKLSSLPVFRYLSMFCGFFVCFTAFGFISLLFIFWLILALLVCLGHLFGTPEKTRLH